MTSLDAPTGQVVTFYSFKGGTGRSMALANVAWILAANGKRVLVADWDLESPGLHRFFKPFLSPDVVHGNKGIVNLIKRFEDEARKDRQARAGDPNRPPRQAGWEQEYARIQDYVLPVKWAFPNDGALDFLTAGLQNDGYPSALSGLDWITFYDRLGGAELFKALRRAMKEQYDYALIDSRTGLNDVADICRLRLPDTLVTCFTFSDQGIEGAADVAREMRDRQKVRPIRVLPVPMRVDQAEKQKRDAGRALARRRFANLPADLTAADRDRYWGAVEVPYEAFYGYEEILATFGDLPGSVRTLLSAYETLTRYITEPDGAERVVSALPPMDEEVRQRVQEQYRRQVMEAASELVLQFAAPDQAWAEWAKQVLAAVDVRVLDLRPIEAETDPQGEQQGQEQILTIVSPALTRRLAQVSRPGDPTVTRLGLLVSPFSPPQLRFQGSVNLAGFGADKADEAVDRLLRLVGRIDSEAADRAHRAAPYPRREPRWNNLPPRNDQFTGRTEVMHGLREAFRGGKGIVTLRGLGGIGKSHLAIEYAYRFLSTYELVWWVKADNVGSLEGAIADLADILGVPAQVERSRTVTSTLESLRRGDPTGEWLIILDNAENPEHLAAVIAKQLPGTPGHILVTTRSQDFDRYATTLEVPVFHRPETTTWLRERVSLLTPGDANAVAEALGDLPLAVDAAIGSLASADVEDMPALVRGLTESAPARTTSVGQALNASFGAALERLRERSPGAHRLLQIFSLMAPDVSTEFVFGDAMAEALVPFDASVTDQNMRQPLLQALERLSLVTQDTRNREVHVHRLLQVFVREQMTEPERKEIRHQIHLVLARSRPGQDVDPSALWPAFRRLWPHLDASAAEECHEPAVWRLLVDRARYLWLRGSWEAAERLALEIAERWQGLLDGPGDGIDATQLESQLLRLRHNLANIWRDQARFGEAYDLDRQTLARLVETLGPDHAQTLRTAGSLAADLRALGRYDEALQRERETSRRWSERFGEQYALALQAANNLAVSLRAVGRFDEARAIDDRLYDRSVLEYGRADPRTLRLANTVGRDMREAGEYRASVDWLSRVLDAHQKATEADRKGRLAAQTNLATSLRSAGHAGRADPLLEDSYRELRELFPDKPDTLACRMNRALNLLVLHQVEEAVAELQQTVKAYSSTLGDSHPLTLVARSNHSAGLLAAGRTEEARSLAAEALAGCRTAVGAEHPYTLAAGTNLAVCHDKAGDRDAAVEQLTRAAEGLARLLGPEHPDSLLSRVCLALVREWPDARGRGNEVGALLDDLTGNLGEDHPTIRDLVKGRLVIRLIDPSDPF